MSKETDDTFARRWSKKIKAIQQLGGKCCKCGCEDPFTLEFHHNDKKNETLSSLFIKQVRWEVIESEISKCKLLCANCHRTIHHKNGRTFELKKQLLLIANKDSCCKCGFKPTDDRTLSVFCFHHIGRNKKFNISDALARRICIPVKRLLDEIIKCDMLCRNCHLKGHIDIERFMRLKDQIMAMVANMRTVPPKVNREKMKALKDEGLGVCEIAKSLNCAKSTVSMALAKM